MLSQPDEFAKYFQPLRVRPTLAAEPEFQPPAIERTPTPRRSPVRTPRDNYWTAEEDAALLDAFIGGLTAMQASARVKRSYNATKKRAAVLGLHLQGRILGKSILTERGRQLVAAREAAVREMRNAR